MTIRGLCVPRQLAPTASVPLVLAFLLVFLFSSNSRQEWKMISCTFQLGFQTVNSNSGVANTSIAIDLDRTGSAVRSDVSHHYLSSRWHLILMIPKHRYQIETCTSSLTSLLNIRCFEHLWLSSTTERRTCLPGQCAGVYKYPLIESFS